MASGHKRCGYLLLHESASVNPYFPRVMPDPLLGFPRPLSAEVVALYGHDGSSWKSSLVQCFRQTGRSI